MELQRYNKGNATCRQSQVLREPVSAKASSRNGHDCELKLPTKARKGVRGLTMTKQAAFRVE
eukprot:4486482-Amphidinium_carterae.1